MESNVVSKDLRQTPLYKSYLNNRDEIEAVLVEWSLTAGNLIKQRTGDKTQVLITMYTLERLLSLTNSPLPMADEEGEDEINQDASDSNQTAQSDAKLKSSVKCIDNRVTKMPRNFA